MLSIIGKVDWSTMTCSLSVWIHIHRSLLFLKLDLSYLVSYCKVTPYHKLRQFISYICWHTHYSENYKKYSAKIFTDHQTALGAIVYINKCINISPILIVPLLRLIENYTGIPNYLFQIETTYRQLFKLFAYATHTLFPHTLPALLVLFNSWMRLEELEESRRGATALTWNK